MPNERAAIDPMGKIIYLLPGIFFTENPAIEIYDDAITVIQKPAILFEVTDNNETQFYYFRAVGWNRNFLIIARRNQDRWEAYNCLRNHSREILSLLLNKGKQII